MTLTELLHLLSRFAASDGFDSAAVLTHLDATVQRAEFIACLMNAVTRRELSNAVWMQTTRKEHPVDFERSIASLWELLWNLNGLEEADGNPFQWNKGALRIWAYTDSWVLISQDEDLLFMSERLLPNMLEIAAETRCPKREYMLQIAAHWARDHSFAAVGKPEFSALVARIGKLAPAIELAGDARLAKYFVRLASYGQPGTVSESDAIQRGRDLNRCYEPPREAVSVRREDANWVVALPGSPGSG
jgi:hypothetical protein